MKKFLAVGGISAGWFSFLWQLLLWWRRGPRCEIYKHGIVLDHCGPSHAFHYGVEFLARNNGEEGVSIDDVVLSVHFDDGWKELKRMKQKMNSEGSDFKAIEQIFDIDSKRTKRVWGVFQNPNKNFIPTNLTEYKIEASLTNGKKLHAQGKMENC